AATGSGRRPAPPDWSLSKPEARKGKAPGFGGNRGLASALERHRATLARESKPTRGLADRLTLSKQDPISRVFRSDNFARLPLATCHIGRNESCLQHQASS